MDTLTARDRLILAGIAAGDPNAKIARTLGVTPGRLGNIRTDLFRRIGAINAANAVDVAHRNGLFRTTTEDQT